MKIIFKILIPVATMLLLAVASVSFIGYTNISNKINNEMEITTDGTLDDIAFEMTTVEDVTKTLKDSLNNNFLRIARSVAFTINSDL